MRLLFVHQNFPGQYRHLASSFARNRGHSAVAIGEARDPEDMGDEDAAIRFVPYAAPTLPPAPVHRYLRGTEIAVRRAEQVRDAAAGLKRHGFVPDIIYAHTGWGEALLLKDIFPSRRRRRLVRIVVRYCDAAGSGTASCRGRRTSVQPSMPSGYQMTLAYPMPRIRLAAFQDIQQSRKQ